MEYVLKSISDLRILKSRLIFVIANYLMQIKANLFVLVLFYFCNFTESINSRVFHIEERLYLGELVIIKNFRNVNILERTDFHILINIL
jgi:hypothetical protein